MPTFNTTGHFPPCRVTKKLLELSEKHILQRAADFERGEESKGTYRVTITDGDGTETLQSVSEFRHDVFPATTERIRLQYKSHYSARDSLEITMSFDDEAPSTAYTWSAVAVSVTSDMARAQATMIRDTILADVKSYAHYHFVRRRSTAVTNASLGFFSSIWLGALILLATATKENLASRWHVFAALIGLGLLVSGYAAITMLLPYCYFDSPVSEKRLEQIRFYSRALIIVPVAQAIIQMVVAIWL
jgi:hypothetical protein